MQMTVLPAHVSVRRYLVSWKWSIKHPRLTCQRTISIYTHQQIFIFFPGVALSLFLNPSRGKGRLTIIVSSSIGNCYSDIDVNVFKPVCLIIAAVQVKLMIYSHRRSFKLARAFAVEGRSLSTLRNMIDEKGSEDYSIQSGAYQQFMHRWQVHITPRLH